MSEIFSNIGAVLTLVGALGLFLFGMKLMSESLQKVAGSKMRQILGAMTNNRIKGVFTGLLVTTTIQSSSATTVMIVSFVNAGLISLVASVGVIMGANIGTTVTAWIIAILGFKVKLSFLSLPLIGLSFPLIFSKKGQLKSWGEFVMGFAILFIGLQFLKESVPGIDGDSNILRYLGSLTDMGYASIFLFVMVGTVLTVIIQSSSATMALTLVMCYNGLIPFEMAAAMVLGENIGTTITANLAALVANVTAKRTARAHLIFNSFGVIWMLILFPWFLEGLDWFLQEKHGISILNTNLSQSDYDSVKFIYPIALAVFHTTFNIINTLVLFGFAPFIAKVATKMVPDRGEEDESFRLQFISSGVFSTSEIAIVQAQKEISSFGIRLNKMFSIIQKMMDEEKNKKFHKYLAKVGKHEEVTDELEVEIAEYLMRVSETKISHDSSKKIRAMLKIIDDMESVGDSIFQLSKIMELERENKTKLNDDQKEALNDMYSLIEEAFSEMSVNLENNFRDIDSAKAIAIEQKINEQRNQMRRQHVEDLKEKKYKHKIGSIYSDMFSVSEKIGDYIINVSEAIDEYKDTE